MNLHWNVIIVLSRNEKKVAEKLNKLGFDIYLPIQQQLRQWSDRKKWVDIVVLPGYVFVRTKPDKYLQILEITGVSRFLKMSGKPVVVPEQEMSRFQHFIEKTEDSSIEFLIEKPSVGTLVTIQSGKFKGFSGEVVRHKGKYKLTIQLLNIGYFLTDISLADIEIKN